MLAQAAQPISGQDAATLTRTAQRPYARDRDLARYSLKLPSARTMDAGQTLAAPLGRKSLYQIEIRERDARGDHRCGSTILDGGSIKQRRLTAATISRSCIAWLPGLKIHVRMATSYLRSDSTDQARSQKESVCSLSRVVLRREIGLIGQLGGKRG